MSDLYKDIKNKATFKKIESLCTQEDLPQCSASCPINLDIKTILYYMGKKDYEKAYDIYAKAIAFPYIVSRTCDRPCETGCKMKNLGGSIQIGNLESYLVLSQSKPYKKPLYISQKNKSIAIIGGGLRGLSAAFELLIKGYEVTVYEKKSSLLESIKIKYGGLLSDIEMESDLKKLFDLGLKVEYDRKLDFKKPSSIIEFLQDENKDGIYISNKDSKFFNLGDRFSLKLNIGDSIFSGSRTNKDSTIYKLFDGKVASISLDRSLEGVSIISGRKDIGSYKTSLYTNLDNHESSKPIIQKSKYFDSEEAALEASRCIQCECLECVKACSFMSHYGAYPKQYIRMVYNNISKAWGSRDANHMINSCNLCGQCKEICPNGLDMGQVYLAAREIMVDNKKMPPSAYEFALMDMEYSSGKDFYLLRNQPGHDKSSYVYFPSCQLAASEPDLLIQTYEDLTKKLDGGVGIYLSCCGIMAHWAGEKQIFHEKINKIRMDLESLGNPIVISSCPMCLKTLKEFMGIEVIGIWTLFDNWKLNTPSTVPNKTLTIYDSCSARYDQETQDSIRNLGEKLGYKLQSMNNNLEKTPCCGYGGLTPFSHRALAKDISYSLKEQGKYDYLTYCVNCRDRLLEVGKNSYHILELVYGEKNSRRKPPTWSQRQENRAYTKLQLLNIYWGEELKEEDLACNLYVSKEVEKILDNRMILISDIEKTILFAEKNKRYFKDLETGNKLASLSLGNVTFWVEYRNEGDGYKVFKAYSHRMTFKILNE